MTTTTLPPFFNYHVGTDTKPYMLVKQVSEKKVIVKSMNHEILPEGYEPKEGEYTRSQESMEKGGITWLITPNDNGIERTLSLRKTGQWFVSLWLWLWLMQKRYLTFSLSGSACSGLRLFAVLPLNPNRTRKLVHQQR